MGQALYGLTHTGEATGKAISHSNLVRSITEI